MSPARGAGERSGGGLRAVRRTGTPLRLRKGLGRGQSGGRLGGIAEGEPQMGGGEGAARSPRRPPPRRRVAGPDGPRRLERAAEAEVRRRERVGMADPERQVVGAPGTEPAEGGHRLDEALEPDVPRSSRRSPSATAGRQSRRVATRVPVRPSPSRSASARTSAVGKVRARPSGASPGTAVPWRSTIRRTIVTAAGDADHCPHTVRTAVSKGSQVPGGRRPGAAGDERPDDRVAAEVPVGALEVDVQAETIRRARSTRWISPSQWGRWATSTRWSVPAPGQLEHARVAVDDDRAAVGAVADASRRPGSPGAPR